MLTKALLSSLLFVIVLGAVLPGGPCAASIQDRPGFPGAAVEHALGVKGVMTAEGAYMFNLPRDGVQVRVGNVTLSPAMALDSWAGFWGMDGKWMMMADLVLRPEELLAAQDAMRREGLEVTAIHNTLVGETPQVYDVHIGCTGDPEKMARALRVVLESANFTIGLPDDHLGVLPQYQLETGMIDRTLGVKGKYKDALLQYRMPRRERITENGMEVPPSMDVATLIKLQPLPDGQAAMAGEFVLLASEVQPVFRALNENGITVTATHTHMLNETPRLFYLHVWAVGDPLTLSSGLRKALDQTNVSQQSRDGIRDIL